MLEFNHARRVRALVLLETHILYETARHSFRWIRQHSLGFLSRVFIDKRDRRGGLLGCDLAGRLQPVGRSAPDGSRDALVAFLEVRQKFCKARYDYLVMRGFRPEIFVQHISDVVIYLLDALFICLTVGFRTLELLYVPVVVRRRLRASQRLVADLVVADEDGREIRIRSLAGLEYDHPGLSHEDNLLGQLVAAPVKVHPHVAKQFAVLLLECGLLFFCLRVYHRVEVRTWIPFLIVLYPMLVADIREVFDKKRR